MESLVWPAMVPFGNYILNTLCFCVCFSRLSAPFGVLFWTMMGHWVLSLLTHCRSVCAPCASPLQGELCTDPLPTHWHISHSVLPCLLTSNWGGHSLIASVCFFSLFVVASAGSPSFTGFCYEPRWVLWFLPGLHPFWFSLHLCLRILLGFPFVDPMPTHRLISRRDRFFCPMDLPA